MYMKCRHDEISLNNVSLSLPLCVVNNRAPTFVQWVSMRRVSILKSTVQNDYWTTPCLFRLNSELDLVSDDSIDTCGTNIPE